MSHGVARSSLPLERSAKAREQELQKIEKYNNLVSEVQALKSSNTYTPASLDATSTLLSQNPEFNTIWNFRRRILLHLISEPSVDGKPDKNKTLAALTKELTFLIPLLQSYPKCYWIWNYRKFLLLTVNEELDTTVALKVWKSEMGLVDKMLSRDARNFHGWGYRRAVVAAIEQLERASSGLSGEGRAEEVEKESSMVESEFEYTTAMFKRNMSNFSAWHNRSKLIPRLLDERGANSEERRTFLDGELGTMQEAVFTDPYDQSLHLYHHWLLSSSCSSPSSQTAEASSSTEIVSLSPPQKLETLARTLTWMKELLDEEPECRLLLEEVIYVAGLAKSIMGQVDPSDVEEAVELSIDGVTGDMKVWLETLMEVDPMRMGRWKEMAERL